MPPQALAIMAHRLKKLCKYAAKEVAGGTPPMPHPPLAHTVTPPLPPSSL